MSSARAEKAVPVQPPASGLLSRPPASDGVERRRSSAASSLWASRWPNVAKDGASALNPVHQKPVSAASELREHRGTAYPDDVDVEAGSDRATARRLDAARDPFTRLDAVLAARRRPMSERLELALSWDALAAELRAWMRAATKGETA